MTKITISNNPPKAIYVVTYDWSYKGTPPSQMSYACLVEKNFLQFVDGLNDGSGEYTNVKTFIYEPKVYHAP